MQVAISTAEVPRVFLALLPSVNDIPQVVTRVQHRIHCSPNTAEGATSNVVDKPAKRMDWALTTWAGPLETAPAGRSRQTVCSAVMFGLAGRSSGLWVYPELQNDLGNERGCNHREQINPVEGKDLFRWIAPAGDVTPVTKSRDVSSSLTRLGLSGVQACICFLRPKAGQRRFSPKR